MVRLALVFTMALVMVMVMVVEAGSEVGLGWFPSSRSGSVKWCEGGSVGECLGEEEEMGMESESNRRILQQANRYISYAALGKSNVPCSRTGASYYNCRPGAQRNPYTRSCPAITRCARG